MRSALICLFFLLTVRGSREDGDFRPTPIPLDEWHGFDRHARAGTLHETFKTDSPPTVAAIPAHYWEDALRHSVYLTLVRDKIDQLIAKGDVISPDTKPDQYASKEVDDHDLWDKIKNAPFERLAGDEPSIFGDVTIMAKGRLLEEKGGYKFTEDDKSQQKCNDDRCSEGVKAFWSVKRVRQRDFEMSPGRYHYELTFSVTSHAPKKQKKPYENPVRTFTVRESTPEKVVDAPQEHRSHERFPPPTRRPERAIWFHKNIVPTQYYQSRQYHGLDRIFSSFSLFSDDDEYEPPRYRPNTHIAPNPHAPPHGAPAPYPQNSKAGYAGSSSDQQKRLTPYPYKPHSYKYSRPPLPPPPYAHPPHHYLDADQAQINNAYAHFGPPNKPFGPPSRPISRPPVLPTPVNTNNWTEVDAKKPNTSDVTTKEPEFLTIQNKPRPPININYMPERVRPPVYNAPPGVFVTMDKKPFKPMPPLKYVTKTIKTHRPIDFRPSPQVLDMQSFSEPNPLRDTAFRPMMAWNSSEKNTTEKIEVAESSTAVNTTRKPNTKGKKPPKKHENIKAQRLTTPTPDIITVSDVVEESDPMEWANIVGAFTKTTPMEADKEKADKETTTLSTTTTVHSTTARRRVVTTTEPIEEITTTTQRPRKRTRPPPKFSKPEKVKKHKRITSTTKAPDKAKDQDLTPQASSAATKPVWTKTNTTTTTSTTTTTTTPKPTTTTTKSTTQTSIEEPKHSSESSVSLESQTHTATTQPKIKNRFRQSTLLVKGTSVKSDKWSVVTEKTKQSLPIKSSAPRRKGSNFHGYMSSTLRTDIHDENSHEDHGTTSKSSTTTEAVKITKPTSPTYEETADQYEYNSETSDYSNDDDVDNEGNEEDSRDQSEYIFEVSSTTPSDRSNEIFEQDAITTEQIATSSQVTKKCKKKKNSTTTEESKEHETTTTTEPTSTKSYLEELFASLSVSDEVNSQSTSKPEPDVQESENHHQFVKIDDDLQDFLDSLDNEERDLDGDVDDYEDDDKEPTIEEDFDRDEDEEEPSPRESRDTGHPYSLLELMAMA